MENKNLNFFKKNGYLLIESLFSEKEVLNLRKKIQELSNNRERMFLLSALCFKQIEIYKLIFNKKLVETYREIIQEDVYLVPDLHIQINNFPKDKFSGWHYDSQSERRNEYSKEKNRKFFRVGIYLQDNNSDHGGGIDVDKSILHKFIPLRTPRFIEIYIVKFFSILFSKTINFKKGSAILFDSKLPHRSTSRKISPDNENYKDKYTIYFSIGSKKNCELYLKNSINRMFQNHSRPEASKYFSNHVKLHELDDFSTEFLDMLKLNKIGMITSGKEQSTFFKSFEKYIENLK